MTFEDEKGETQNFSTQNFESYFKENRSSKFNSIYGSKEEAMEDIETYKNAVKGPGWEFVAENISLTPQPQSSVSIIDPSNGDVLAIVGGRGTKEASLTLNRASDTKRQPGSCFKVLAAYAPALETGQYTLASTQLDAPYNYANGRPVKNWYGDAYRGICTYRYGIEQSLNIVTVKALTDITPRVGFDMLLNMGFTTLVEKRTEWDGSVSSDITQSLALGGLTDGVTNIELTAAFAGIQNGGVYNKPRFYTTIVDHDGQTLIDNTVKSRQFMKASNAYCLTSAMQDVVTKGTGAKVNFGNMAIAGKTGTTTSNVDVWFSGYTPYYACSTWVGYDNNVHMVSGETNTAKYLWKAIMGRIHENLEYKDFIRPEGVVSATVCAITGKAPNVFCTQTRTEIMDKDSVPTDLCPGHDILLEGMLNGEAVAGNLVLGQMCSETGKMATATCPYLTTGMVNPFGGYCIHSYQDGNPMFSSEDVTDQTENAEQYKQAAQAQAALAAEAQAAAAAEQTLNALGLGGNDTAPQIDPNLLNAANQIMGQ